LKSIAELPFGGGVIAPEREFGSTVSPNSRAVRQKVGSN